MRFLGLNSAVVDGGLAGWMGLPAATSNSEASVVETHAPQISPTAGYYLFASEAVPLIGSQRVQFVDVRNSDERASGPYRNLAIPGALDLPRSSLANGPLLGAPGELTRLFNEAGIDLARHLILIGPTGLDTATAWLALSLMGATEVTIVDGGWSQWLDTPGAPLTG